MSDKPPLWNPESGRANGMTDLHFAAYNQDLEEVQRCVEAGYDVNFPDISGWTPVIWTIFMAATGGIGVGESIVDYLESRGAKLEFCNKDSKDIIEFARNYDELMAEHLEKKLRRAKAD